MVLAQRETTRVRGRQLVALATILVAIALGSASAREWAEDPRTKKEYALKAAFLYNFGKFVTWPTGDGEQDEPFVIAILGEDPFGPFIDQALGGKKIKGREVRIRRVAGTDGLFGAYDRGEENCTVEQRLQHTPIVTVTANAMVGDRETRLEAGADAYLSKPFKADELVSVVAMLGLDAALADDAAARRSA